MGKIGLICIIHLELQILEGTESVCGGKPVEELLAGPFLFWSLVWGRMDGGYVLIFEPFQFMP